VVAFLQSFNEKWAQQYVEKRLGQMEAAFNSIYAQRNKIAHGDASNSNITYNSILISYEANNCAIELLKIIISK
jgi:hypothetical protein